MGSLVGGAAIGSALFGGAGKTGQIISNSRQALLGTGGSSAGGAAGPQARAGGGGGAGAGGLPEGLLEADFDGEAYAIAPPVNPTDVKEL